MRLSIVWSRANLLINAILGLSGHQLKVEAQGGGSDTTIRIEGGIPSLPGCDMIMPAINGHVIESTPVPAIESTPVSVALKNATGSSEAGDPLPQEPEP
jgi:hypothetical protein